MKKNSPLFHFLIKLSRALRNRFTEIWCHSDYDNEEINDIIKMHLLESISKINSTNSGQISISNKFKNSLDIERISKILVQFFNYYNEVVFEKSGCVESDLQLQF